MAHDTFVVVVFLPFFRAAHRGGLLDWQAGHSRGLGHEGCRGVRGDEITRLLGEGGGNHVQVEEP